MSAVPLFGSRRRWRRGSSDARILAVTARHLDETGEWPTVEDVQAGLVACIDLSDAERKIDRLPGWLGRRADGRVVLSVFGLHRGDPNGPLLEDFEAALVLAVREYRGVTMPGRAVLSPAVLAERLSMSAARASRALTLLEAEGLIVPAEADRMAVTRAIRPYLYVRNVDEYMRMRKREECRGRRRRVRELPGRILRWFRSEDTSVAAKIAVGALSTAISAVLLAAIALGAQQLDASAEDPPRPAPTPVRPDFR